MSADQIEDFAEVGPRADPFDVTWRERVVVLGGLALVVITGLIFAERWHPRATAELVALVPIAFFAVGKFLPLWGISGKSNFGPYELGLVIACLDLFTVLTMVYALEGFYRLQTLKRWLDKVQSNAALVLRAYPRFRRAAVFGIFLFVLFPVAGTGAIGATFLGIFLGIHRVVLIGTVAMGGLVGGLLMAFAASHFSGAMRRFQAFQENPTIKYAVMLGVLATLVACLWLLNRAYQRALQDARGH